MTDTKNPGDKTLSVGKTLTLKRPSEQGTVRQSFSHGRSKTVVVEKVKRRVIGPGGETVPAPVSAPPIAPAPAPTRAPAAAQAPRQSDRPQRRPSAPSGSGVILRTLTEGERDARAQALADARVYEAEERKRAEEEARRRAVREAEEAREREAAEARQREEDARRAAEDEIKRKSQTEAERRAPAAVPAPVPGADRAVPAQRVAVPAPSARPVEVEDEDGRRRGAPAVKRPGGGVRAPVVPAKPEKPKTAGERQRGRLTVTNAHEAGEERARSIASYRRRMQRATGHRNDGPKEKIMREVVIPETITVQELANRMSERAVDVVRLLMKQGQMIKITDVIESDTAQLIAEEMGHTVRRVAESDVETGLFATSESSNAEAIARAPVVTIMGHVDHGKTSLLDAIRQTNVVSGEAGGITQHIGAYQVTAPSGGKVTFIDTPGHAAFTAMRARGAQVTDIVILVVAADDGVMPQTAEAIAHSQAAGVPIIVAINKIDKPDAKPERVRTELLQHSIVVESLGGETIEVEVSAKQKLNLDKLLEMIALQAEILDLKAAVEAPAEGIVIEAKLDKGRGPVATVLIQRGTLRQGDIVVAGSQWGKVRALNSDLGKPVDGAGPSDPVEVLGFGGTPEAGDRVAVVDTEARAREITEYRERVRREKQAARSTGQRGSLEQMMSQLKSAEGRKEFTLVIKGDVQGSVEAIIGSLEKLGNDEVAARVIHSGVGGITESDISLAEASGAAVIGFNVRANSQARDAAARDGTEIRYYNIIYDLVDDVKSAMSGLLSPERRETFLGNAEILEVFNITKIGKVAGCRITEGVVQRGSGVRLIRDNVVVHEGKLSTLKRFKDEVKEVVSGQECGMAFEGYQDMRAGDVIECYRVEEIQRTL